MEIRLLTYWEAHAEGKQGIGTWQQVTTDGGKT